MNSLSKLIAVVGTAFFLTCGAMANGEHGTKQEAVSLVKKAIAHYKANGKEKTLADINAKLPQLVDRDMYVYILDANGFALAHGANEKLVGRPLMQLKDADGKPFVQELVTVLKSGKSGWVDYKWPNPITKQIEQKTTYVEPHGEIGFAVGIYK